MAAPRVAADAAGRDGQAGSRRRPASRRHPREPRRGPAAAAPRPASRDPGEAPSGPTAIGSRGAGGDPDRDARRTRGPGASRPRSRRSRRRPPHRIGQSPASAASTAAAAGLPASAALDRETTLDDAAAAARRGPAAVPGIERFGGMRLDDLDGPARARCAPCGGSRATSLRALRQADDRRDPRPLRSGSGRRAGRLRLIRRRPRSPRRRRRRRRRSRGRARRRRAGRRARCRRRSRGR